MEPIIAACNDELLLRGEGELEEFSCGEQKLAPGLFLEKLTYDADTSVQGFLHEFGTHPVHMEFLSACDRPTLDDEWTKFLEAVTKELKSCDPGQRSRYILVSLADSESHQRLKSPVIKLYQLWNPITWEETRVLASTLLGPEPSEISKIWMIATYTGACCSDPQLLERLCSEKPKSLASTIELALGLMLGDHGDAVHLSDPAPIGGWRPWSVPEESLAGWANGFQIGATLDRGFAGLPPGLSKQDRQASLGRRIWREQAAGLFPLIAELSTQSLQLLNSWLGKGWCEHLASYSEMRDDEVLFTEPSIVLRFLREQDGAYGRLPKTIIELLYALKNTRNSIAHLQPVELTRLTSLWDFFYRARGLSRR